MPKPFDCVDDNKMWKILKEMGIPDHFTCLLRNLYAGQEATVRTRHGTMDWFKIGKEVWQCCILSPCLFNLYAEYIMRNSFITPTSNAEEAEVERFHEDLQDPLELTPNRDVLFIIGDWNAVIFVF